MGQMEKQQQIVKIHYGSDGLCELEVGGKLDDRRDCAGCEVDDLRSAVFATLASPIEFPPLEQAIVEGDRVAIAVDPSVPRLSAVVATVVEYLVEHDVDPTLLSIVVAGRDEHLVDSLCEALRRVTTEHIEVELHDADDSTKLAYLAANEAADPIYMNRTLVEAEVVIPITCARGRDALDYFGVYSMFPRLSDRRTRSHFLNLARLEQADERMELTKWADQAAWWVGLCIAIQVVPGAEGGVLAVRAGSPQALESTVQKDMETAWTTPVTQPFSSVIAVVDGNEVQQTWENVARAIYGAQRAVARDGTIVVCSQLSDPPGRALKRLRGPNRAAETLAKQLAHDLADDALAAAVILEAVQDYHVYLLSKLDSGTIEELGMGAVENAEQLERLIAQHGSCLILGSAQHRLVHVAD